MIFESRHVRFSSCIGGFLLLVCLMLPGPAGAVDVEVRGNVDMRAPAVRNLMGFLPWDGRRDAEAVDALQQAYIRKGHVFTRIRIERVAADSTIVVHIEEGPLSRVGRVRISGTDHFNAEEVARVMAVERGDVFVSGRVDGGIRELLDMYDRDGFPFAQVWIDSLVIAPDDATVAVGITVVEGEHKNLTGVEFEGLKQTREDLAVRLSGLRVGEPYDGKDVEEAYLRLSSSGIFESVEYPEIRVSSAGEGVEAVIHVVEPVRRNSFSLAAGYADREGSENGVLSGQVHLQANNLGGALRDLEVFWSNDGADRSETRLRFRQRYIFGLPPTVGIRLEQTGLDTLYTWQSLGLESSTPVGRLGRGLLGLDLSLFGDRNTFSTGTISKSIRYRVQGGFSFEAGRRDRGRFLSLAGQSAWASKRLDNREGGGETVSQYIVETGVRAAAEPFRSVHVTTDIQLRNLSSGEAVVPLSEQYYLGGAGTLRGYRENQFHSRRVAWARNEILIGHSRLEHLYVFLDVGYFLDETVNADDSVSTGDVFRLGHGFGLRTSSPAGRIDISFALGEKLSLQQTKVHVILDRSF